MSSLAKELVESGIHFGQRRSNWNPRMAPYIHSTRNQVHVIDVRETIKGLLLAKRFIQKIVSEGKDVCFVGTKRQARGTVETRCAEVHMPYVTERWLGGMLTNWQTISQRVEKMEDYEAMMSDGRMEKLSKKEQLEVTRSYEKLSKNLGGIRNMKKLPQAVFVVGVAEEETAVREANKLGIPVIGIVDTNADPTDVKFPVPGNDDAIRSINLFARVIAETIEEGKQARNEGRDQVDMAAAAPSEPQATATLDGDDSKVEAPAADTDDAAEAKPE